MRKKFKAGLVSIIVPVYNREVYVKATIDSILKQTYSNIEIIAINDGSTDNSLVVLESMAKKNLARFIILDQKNQGQTKARNNGIQRAKGEFIAFLDSDDLWRSDKLDKQIPLFNDQVGLVFSGIDNIDENSQFISTELIKESIRGDIHSQLLIKNQMTGGTVVVKHSVLLDVGLFDESLPAAENWDLWLRIAKVCHADFVNEALVKYRKHPDNMSKDNELMHTVTRTILQKHLPGSLDEQENKPVYQQAYAHFFYRKGVYQFSSGDLKTARQHFRDANQLIRGYKDCNTRIFRTYLGRTFNNMLTILKKSMGSAAEQGR